MPEDSSLDDFAPDAEREATGPDGPSDAPTEADTVDRSHDEAPADAGEGGDDSGNGAETVAPATPTSMWHADGADCDRCGERVERRWCDDDAFVCADCAPW